jgi:hypothetical protein
MRFEPLNFTKQTYRSRSKPMSSQDMVNVYVEPAEDGKGKYSIFGTAGQSLFSTIGTSPIWGTYYWNDTMFVVTNNSVYTVAANGAFALLGAIGTVEESVEWTNIAENVILLKQNGDAYVLTTTTITQITDTDYQSASSVTAIDQYVIFTQKDSDYFFVSALNNPLSYSSLAYARAEGQADKLVKAFATLKEVWLFGEITTEVYINTGTDVDVPFEPLQGTTIQKGCAAKLSVKEQNNVVIWLAEDKSIYGAIGYTPEKISTYAIDEEIRKMSRVDDAVAYTCTEAGHDFYIITFPTGGRTFCYDVSTKMWHRRKTYGYDYWNVSGLVSAFGKNITASFSTGKLYELNLDTYSDDDLPIERIITSPTIFDSMNKVRVFALAVDFDTGEGTLTGQGQNPKAMLQRSVDGGRTWSSELWKELGQQSQYEQRVVWRNLGYGNSQLIYKITITDPIKICINGVYIIAGQSNN